MLTAAMMRSLAGKTVDEIGFSKQGTPHLHELETFGKHLLHALAVDNTAHIYERKLERGAETLRIFKEIKGLERLFRYHVFPYHADSIFEPPLLHIMRHAVDGHLATHHIHRSLADESSAQHDGVRSEAFDLLGYRKAILNFHASLEAVAHIGLHDDTHIAAGCLHHLFQTHTHETHAGIKIASEFIATAVGIWRKELGDQIAVAGMHLNAVKPRVAGGAHRIAEVAGHLPEFVLAQSAHYRGRI